jgi:hypothetical protein
MTERQAAVIAGCRHAVESYAQTFFNARRNILCSEKGGDMDNFKRRGIVGDIPEFGVLPQSEVGGPEALIAGGTGDKDVVAVLVVDKKIAHGKAHAYFMAGHMSRGGSAAIPVRNVDEFYLQCLADFSDGCVVIKGGSL